MADADAYIKPQSQVSEIGSSIPPVKEKPSKSYTHFLYKALIASVCLVILPLFPSQAPEFINQTILTSNWELLHLLVVGVAVTYGIFSRLNVETETANYSRSDSVQNYMSRILQVSSVSDDEVESPYGYEENEVQTWKSRYFRGEPDVLVAQEKSFIDEQSESGPRMSNKPLLLPVRNLRSHVSDQCNVESIDKPSGLSGLLSRSGSDLKGSSSSSSSNSDGRTGNGESRSLDTEEVEKKFEENVVLPSPVPWRSRSGRMELKEDLGSVDKTEFDSLRSWSFRSPSSRSYSSSSSSASPKNVSPSPSVSPESHPKNVEDLGRKDTFNGSKTSPSSNGFSSQKEPKRSSKDKLKELKNGRDSRTDSLKSEVKPKTHIQGSPVGKSVRTIRASEPVPDMRKAREMVGGQVEEKGRKKSPDVEAVLMEKPGRKTSGYGERTHESPSPTPRSALSKPRVEEKKEFADSVSIESDKDLDGDADVILGSLYKEGNSYKTFGDGGHDPSEVDQKAAEFIAKFREQMRLQRIESIKKSNSHHSIRNS